MALFHQKANKWVEGRKQLWTSLEQALQTNTKPVIWFHVASLGEFEQARPVIEGLKAAKEEQFFLLLSFFSPSGYEVRKTYEHADFVTYLPLDLPINAKRWLDIVKPIQIFWVKYDFWWHVLREAQARKIQMILFSAVFRPNQFFFKPSGSAFLDILKGFHHIFVQNEESLALLEKYHFQQASIAGDTRFDRVLANVASFEPISLVEKWCASHENVVVAGSVWERDLEVLLPVLAQKIPYWKAIIAPHEIHESTLRRIEKSLPAQTIRYSVLMNTSPTDMPPVLLIDNVGMLAKLYHYGNWAYIGGAFKEGLHNILEPAAFSIPVVFGADYRKFPEADALIKVGGAFSIQNQATLQRVWERFEKSPEERKEAGKHAQNFIRHHKGGAAKILSFATIPFLPNL